MPRNNVCKLCAGRDPKTRTNKKVSVKENKNIEIQTEYQRSSSSDRVADPPSTSSDSSIRPKLLRSQSLPATSPRWDNAGPGHISANLLLKFKDGGRSKDSWVTMLQHYYPEGGWGWVILSVATFVAILNHGLHTATGSLLAIIATEFHQATYSIGKYYNFKVFVY